MCQRNPFFLCRYWDVQISHRDSKGLSCLVLSYLVCCLQNTVCLCLLTVYYFFSPKYILEEMCLFVDNIFTNPGHLYIPQLNHGEVVEMNGLEHKAHDFDTGDRQQL